MDQPIIEIEGITKEYVLAHKQPYVTMRDTLTELAKKPFQIFRPSAKSTKEYFLALKGITFSIQKGEAIGLIGPNGSGKSTLLKILSQITPPTSGQITIRGRVASLLEVGTGFHPELTGRENIFLNGAILGMKKQEILRKFDEIVKFSGVEKFLDTPVKRYSSGMLVRLAFSVAAHLEPEILLVDEVLAVGDAEFQKKCLGKMDEVTKDAGRTIIFVSHNMEAIKKLCQKCVLLREGEIVMFDETSKVIQEYLFNSQRATSASLTDRKDRAGDGAVKFTHIAVTNTEQNTEIHSGDKLRFTLQYKGINREPIRDVRVVVIVHNDDMRPLLWLDSEVCRTTLPEELSPEGTIVCETEAANIVEGRYFVEINFHIKGVSQDLIMLAAEFDVVTDLDTYNFQVPPNTTVVDHLIEYQYSQLKT